MNTNTSRYRASVSREDGYWVAVVDGVRGGATESRSLARLDGEVRDLLAGLLDIDDTHTTEIEYDYNDALGPDTAREIERVHQARLAARTTQHDYEAQRAAAIADLRTAGVSTRDAAALLGITFQRVQQIAAHIQQEAAS
ncbi:MAG: hypothetical protein ACRDQA_02000 [Nocardioidaceae bacterium]